ncbi:MAG: magnesium transporter [Gammaproteobacteria bacterium]|nr:magnesium transporter [Gammaproteobacteria bacterium]
MPAIEQSAVRERLLEALEAEVPSDVRTLLSELHPADTADILESLPPDQRRAVWAQVGLDAMGEILTEVSDGVRRDLLDALDPKLLVSAVRGLDIDDIADLIPNLSEEVIADIQLTVAKKAREGLDAVLSYPQDTAGGLMNVDTVTVRESLPLAVVLRYLRLRAELPEYTDKLFVVDRSNRLKGVLFVSTLLTADAAERVAEHVDSEPIKFNALTPDSDVAAAFERYNLISAPVVDDSNTLLGRITIDDVVDVIREEADHTVMARAGLDVEEDIFAPVARSTRSRAMWLGINLITALIASWVILQFERTIEQLVALAVLMPIVASMGGNAGTQTLTIVIRGLGTGTIEPANAWQVLKKEFLVGGLNGVLWALAVALVAIVWYHNLHLALIIGLAMMINIVASAIAGVLLPVAFDRLGVDPALASGVALTTVTDVIGFLSVLGLAALFLL